MTVRLFRNVSLVTPVDHGKPSAGERQRDVVRHSPGAMLVADGHIAAAGAERDVLTRAREFRVDMEVDGGGRCCVPGFVDPHTHACFAKTRESEFSLRLSGVPYLEILKQGGGILSSVRAVRSATDDELFAVTRANAMRALASGTTTMEMKSGYGLDTASELRMLAVIDRVRRETPLDVAITFMGAHAVPEEFRGSPDAYVDLLVQAMIPAAADQGLAGYCDVFCEEGVFSVAQSRRILEAGKKAGLRPRVHADEVHDTGGAALAAEVGAVSAEHLLAAGDAGLDAMARAGVVANLLPATAYSLRKPYARARFMIERGLPVAVATDCNPGSCYCESMPFVFGLSVMQMGLTVEEALTAATLNAAYAIALAGRVGSLEPGKQADFLLLDGGTPAAIAYHAGGPVVDEVYKLGERVATRGACC